MGAEAVEHLRPFDTWDEVGRRWAALREMISAAASGRDTGFAAVPDIRELLGVREGVLFEGKDLVSVSGALAAASRVKTCLEGAGEALKAMVSEIDPLEGLAWEIDATLLPTGEISDDASPVLRQLRRKARTMREAILEKLGRIMDGLKSAHVVMEDLVTIRNERYVIPLRHDYASHIRGITHDYSRSNKTAYVEPLAVVEDNNALSQVRSDIKEEETAILRDLTSRVLANAQTIRRNLALYGELDLLHASACWALKHDAVIPQISREGIDLRAARHPVLLERLGRERTVPLDIRIPSGKDCLVISGPNAGGKTVALKTLGLLVLMAKSGLAIPADEGSKLSPVGRIWVEMDTNQDIQHDLSSFTAHALSLKRIYEGMEKGDLVLLDEPGTGTDPRQGAAVAVSLIDALRMRGAIVVVTSHSDLIKLYGISSAGVEHAATAFDDTGLKPLYRLEYGMVGESRAFDILASIDFPREVLDEARAIASKEGSSVLARAMEDLADISSLKKQAIEDAEQAAALRRQAREVLDAAEREKVELSLKYRRLIQQAETLASRPQPRERIERVRATDEARELESVLQAAEPARVLQVQPGSAVVLRGTGAKGKVLEVSNDRAEVIMGGKRLNVSLEKIEADRSGMDREETRTRIGPHVPAGYVLPVRVVGMRVDEAIPLVEKALDQALLSGQDRIEIIHGAGTGRLRRAIRTYLQGIDAVRSISDSPMEEGGGNKTIVVFKAG